jgi:hypothetical protein
MQAKTAIDAGSRYWKLLIRFDTAGVYTVTYRKNEHERVRGSSLQSGRTSTLTIFFSQSHSHYGVFKRWHHAELNHPLSYGASGHPLVSAI